MSSEETSKGTMLSKAKGAASKKPTYLLKKVLEIYLKL